MIDSGSGAYHPSDSLVTAGEFYLDLIFYDLREPPQLGEELKTDNFLFAPGGGAAITAAAASRLGLSTRLVAVLGDSPLDLAARAFLDEFGIDLQGIRVEAGKMSGLSVAVSTRADRYFLTYPGTNCYLQQYLLSREGRHDLSQARHVHFALAATDWEPFAQLLEELRAAGTTSSCDMGWDPAAAAAPGFRAFYDRLDVIFLNEMEALRYTDTDSVPAAVAALSSPHNTVVVKLGKAGAVAACRGAPIETSPAIQVQAIESTGAGDSFNGGFLHYWIADAPLSECLRAGNVCGGLSTRAPSGVGALPSREEFQLEFRKRT